MSTPPDETTYPHPVPLRLRSLENWLMRDRRLCITYPSRKLHAPTCNTTPHHIQRNTMQHHTTPHNTCALKAFLNSYNSRDTDKMSFTDQQDSHKSIIQDRELQLSVQNIMTNSNNHTLQLFPLHVLRTM